VEGSGGLAGWPVQTVVGAETGKTHATVGPPLAKEVA
jgi:hypothetical protein